MSGTSKPRVRLSMLGMPSSISRPWISSASAWWRAPATRTSGPSVYWGRTLRARSRAALRGRARSAASDSGRTSGIPHDAQKRSEPGYAAPQDGQTSASSIRHLDRHLVDAAVVDPVQRTSGSPPPASPTMSHSTPGQPAAKFTSVCDG